jgi:hypothetical protein
MQGQSAATGDCFIQLFEYWRENSSDAQESVSKGSEESYGLANRLSVRTNCRPTLTDKSRGWSQMSPRSSQVATILYHPSFRVCGHALRCLMNGIRVTDLRMCTANIVQKETEISKGQTVWEIMQDKHAELSTICCHLKLMKITSANNHSHRNTIKQVQ